MISKKCSYALKAVLALARNSGGRPMTIQQIADAESIPARFLEAILRDLKQTGLTESLRGKDGGYRLIPSPSDITIGQVVRMVQGPLFESEVRSDDVFASVWQEVDGAISEILDHKDFKSLMNDQDARRSSDVLNYSI